MICVVPSSAIHTVLRSAVRWLANSVLPICECNRLTVRPQIISLVRLVVQADPRWPPMMQMLNEDVLLSVSYSDKSSAFFQTSSRGISPWLTRCYSFITEAIKVSLSVWTYTWNIWRIVKNSRRKYKKTQCLKRCKLCLCIQNYPESQLSPRFFSILITSF